MLSRNSGMGPVKLLLERSKFSSTPNVFRPFGIFPCSRFPWKCSNRNWTQLPTASGIAPVSLFIERSIDTRLFKCPICAGMESLRAFVERLRSMVREGMLSISCGSRPLKKLQEISMDTRVLRLPRLGGMVSPRKLLDRESLLNFVIG